MFYKLLLFTLLLPLTLTASCIPQYQTELKEGVLYTFNSATPFEGCVIQLHPDGQKKAELFFHNGKATGEGSQWYENGQKESETIYRSGKIHTKKLWNTEGYLYTFERYKDGVLLQPIEMTYHQAMKACQQATFGGHSDWKLPNVQELYKVPFSEATKEMTLIASNPPVKLQKSEEVSYVRFGATPETAKWDNSDLSIERALHVICVREQTPHAFHLIMGINGIADLASKDMDENIQIIAPQQAAVPKKKSVKQRSIRSGYYINIYTFSKYPPEKKQLENILLSGYRYTFNEIIYDGEKLTRVLIGPFPNNEKAKKELKRVHLAIEPDAYIVDNNY